MNEWMMLMASAVKTGDDADMGKWITIMVVVGVILVVMAVISVVMSKKQKAAEKVNKEESNKKDSK